MSEIEQTANLITQLADGIGVRQAGTAASVEAANAIADEFRALGLEPRFQEFPLLRYDAEEPELWVDGERWAAGPCMYAHPGTCDGEVKRLSDGCWAVGEGRLLRSMFALGKGPIPANSRVGMGGHIATPPTAYISRSDDQRLREGQHLRLIVSGAWVRSRDRNVVAEIPGESSERVVVGAHFDSIWRSKGAIDNASGVEGIRQIGERFAGRQLPRTIELVAFAGEEIGLIGARQYMYAARETDGVGAIVGMVNLDCIGHGDNLYLLCSPDKLRDLAVTAASELGLTERYRILTDLGVPAYPDHAPFADAGIPALTIMHFPYKEYHLPEEAPALIDGQCFADSVELASKLVESQLTAPINCN